MRKLKILNLVGDNRKGGIYSIIESWNQSSLALEFDLPIQAITASYKEILFHKPDLIIFHNACSWGNLPKILWLSLMYKTIIYEHHYCYGFTSNVPNLSRFYLLLRLCYSFVDKVVAVSVAQAKWMLDQGLVKQQKLRMIRPGRDLDALLLVPPLPPTTLPLRLKAYGRFTYQKGFDILLQALRLIPAAPIVLDLGGSGPDEEQLKALAVGLSNVNFIGFVNDLPKFFLHCDAIIVPSRWEPGILSCQEIKAAARPMIASRIDAIPEQVEECGILVDPNNPQSLAEAILALLDLPPSQLQQWGINGREQVRHAWDNHLNQWKNLIKETI
jgi:glycosyltransferase involved in cell wall biosynthesis